jgi:hypothetical protein
VSNLPRPSGSSASQRPSITYRPGRGPSGLRPLQCSCCWPRRSYPSSLATRPSLCQGPLALRGTPGSATITIPGGSGTILHMLLACARSIGFSHRPGRRRHIRRPALRFSCIYRPAGRITSVDLAASLLSRQSARCHIMGSGLHPFSIDRSNSCIRARPFTLPRPYAASQHPLSRIFIQRHNM